MDFRKKVGKYIADTLARFSIENVFGYLVSAMGVLIGGWVIALFGVIPQWERVTRIDIIVYALLISVLLAALAYFVLGAASNQKRNRATHGDDTEASHLANLYWTQGFRRRQIDKPWELNLRIEFIRHAENTACYIRWGELIYYMSGQKAWKWSKQTTVIDTQTVHSGRTKDLLVAEIEPGKKVFKILGDETTGNINQENLICCEIVISSAQGTQRVRRHYGLVSSDHLVPVLIDQERFAGAIDDPSTG